MRGWSLALFAATVITGCGGDDGPSAGLLASPLPVPPAGGSRWAVLESDHDGDGLAESITRYEYDAAGRRTAELSWRAERGVAIGEPVEVLRWSYDSASRLLNYSVQDGQGQRHISATYGADGLLASTVMAWAGTSTSIERRYVWQNLRLVEFAETDGWPAHQLFYDAQNRVERIERQFDSSGETDVDSYSWRADGQLAQASFSLSVGNRVIYSLSYDAAGRHRRTTVTDDGFEVLVSHHFHDSRGRLERVERDNWPASFDEADFLPDTIYRIRWEDGLCQPVYLLGSPPAYDLSITMQAHADGTTLGCAP